jgi:GntR family transcriptional repressor for pyruvate dehydrogenase complex
MNQLPEWIGIGTPRSERAGAGGTAAGGVPGAAAVPDPPEDAGGAATPPDAKRAAMKDLDDTTFDQVVEAIRRRIGSGQTEEGRLAPERTLAAELGVGRRTVRRALDRLEAEGLLWRRQGQGTFVGVPPLPRARRMSPLSEHTSPLDLMEVRFELEPVLARFCALRATGAQLETLARAAAKAADARTAADYETWDSAFHRRIAEAAGNKLFLAMFDAVNAVRRDTRWSRLRESTFSEGRLVTLAAQHAEVLEAIAERDGARAEQAMRRHLGLVGATLNGWGGGEALAAPAAMAAS